jgi:hypothetical protein
MRALIIDGKARTIEVTEVGREDDLHGLIGQDSIIHDDIGEDTAVFFDEDCFIRGTQGRFQIDSLAPIAGKGVVIGRTPDGALHETTLEVEALAGRTKFL